MQGKFLGGALVGGMIGAMVVANWDSLTKSCPFLREVKNKALFEELCNCVGKNKNTTIRPKTRLMARRHRAKKEYCC